MQVAAARQQLTGYLVADRSQRVFMQAERQAHLQVINAGLRLKAALRIRLMRHTRCQLSTSW